MRPDEGCDWSRHYPDIGQDLEEDFPRDFPPMLGMKPVTVTVWFDADNGHDQRNGRSITDILVDIGKLLSSGRVNAKEQLKRVPTALNL